MLRVLLPSNRKMFDVFDDEVPRDVHLNGKATAKLTIFR